MIILILLIRYIEEEFESVAAEGGKRIPCFARKGKRLRRFPVIPEPDVKLFLIAGDEGFRIPCGLFVFELELIEFYGFPLPGIQFHSRCGIRREQRNAEAGSAFHLIRFCKFRLVKIGRSVAGRVRFLLLLRKRNLNSMA